MYKVTVTEKISGSLVLWKYCLSKQDAQDFKRQMAVNSRYHTLIVKVGA